MGKINWNIVKPRLWTGAAGIVVGMFALAKVFGFMSPSAADQLATQKVEAAVIATLAPVCAEKFRALPDTTQRMATLVSKKLISALRAPCGERNGSVLDCARKGAAVTILVACNPVKKHGPWVVARLRVVTPSGDPV